MYALILTFKKLTLIGQFSIQTDEFHFRFRKQFADLRGQYQLADIYVSFICFSYHICTSSLISQRLFSFAVHCPSSSIILLLHFFYLFLSSHISLSCLFSFVRSAAFKATKPACCIFELANNRQMYWFSKKHKSYFCYLFVKSIELHQV